MRNLNSNWYFKVMIKINHHKANIIDLNYIVTIKKKMKRSVVLPSEIILIYIFVIL